MQVVVSVDIICTYKNESKKIWASTNFPKIQYTHV